MLSRAFEIGIITAPSVTDSTDSPQCQCLRIPFYNLLRLSVEFLNSLASRTMSESLSILIKKSLKAPTISQRPVYVVEDVLQQLNRGYFAENARHPGSSRTRRRAFFRTTGGPILR